MSGLVYNRRTQTYSGAVTITSNGSSSVTGPYYVAFQGLSAGVTLTNATAVGNLPAVQVVAAGTALAPGQSVSAAVSFSNPSNVAITYIPVVER